MHSKILLTTIFTIFTTFIVFSHFNLPNTQENITETAKPYCYSETVCFAGEQELKDYVTPGTQFCYFTDQNDTCFNTQEEQFKYTENTYHKKRINGNWYYVGTVNLSTCFSRNLKTLITNIYC